MHPVPSRLRMYHRLGHTHTMCSRQLHQHKRLRGMHTLCRRHVSGFDRPDRVQGMPSRPLLPRGVVSRAAMQGWHGQAGACTVFQKKGWVGETAPERPPRPTKCKGPGGQGGAKAGAAAMPRPLGGQPGRLAAWARLCGCPQHHFLMAPSPDQPPNSQWPTEPMW